MLRPRAADVEAVEDAKDSFRNTVLAKIQIAACGETDEKRKRTPKGKKETDIPFNHYPDCDIPGGAGSHAVPYCQRLLEFLPPDPGHRQL